PSYSISFSFNDPAPPDIYTLSLHDALPISRADAHRAPPAQRLFPGLSRPLRPGARGCGRRAARLAPGDGQPAPRARPWVLGVIHRVLPARAVAHRPGREPAVPGPLPERDAGVGARYRSGLPA